MCVQVTHTQIYIGTHTKTVPRTHRFSRMHICLHVPVHTSSHTDLVSQSHTQANTHSHTPTHMPSHTHSLTPTQTLTRLGRSPQPCRPVIAWPPGGGKSPETATRTSSVYWTGDLTRPKLRSWSDTPPWMAVTFPARGRRRLPFIRGLMSDGLLSYHGNQSWVGGAHPSA